MPSYLHPGVYVEEIPSGSKPIEGASTSVAAFVGQATKGPVGEATLIQSFDDYTNSFGGIVSEGDAMGFAVQAFYLNGGKAAYVCRMVGDGSVAASDTAIGQDTSSNPVLKISATSEGEWGNTIYYRINKPDQDSLTFDLEVGHWDNKGKFVADEKYTGLSMRAADANYALKQVNGNSTLVSLSLEDAADPENIAANQYQDATLTGGKLDTSDDHYFDNCPKTLGLNINGLGTKQITLPASFTTPLSSNFASDAGSLAFEITKAVHGLGTEDAYQNFSCQFNNNDQFELVSQEDGSSASISISDGDLAKLLRIDSKQPAVLTGGPGATNGPFAGNAYFKSSLSHDNETLKLNIDNHGDVEISLTVVDLGLDGADNQADGNKVALAIQNAVRALKPSIASYKDFRCVYVYATTVSGRHFELTSGSGSPRNSGLSVSDGTLMATLALDGASNPVTTLGRSIDQGTAKVIPLHALGYLDQGTALAAGAENPATANDFTDFFDKKLRKVRDVSIMVLPGQQWAKDGSGNPFISATLAHCEAMANRMVIVDPPKALELDQGATVDALGLPSSTYSALYYPWVKVANPLYNADTNPTVDKIVDVAPSGFAAGMWSKTDGRRGVWKAPAGLETGLLGVAGLQYIVEDGEQDQLNPLGVNCLRKMPGAGPVIWGTRTLATQADPEWRYVPVRRTAMMIEQSIYQGIQWAVFEPNKHTLWSSLRANIGGFMNSLFQAGAFQGEKASDAYFVRCGLGDTMTQADIDAGQVIVIVGFAPLKPAEFVIVRIQQKVNQQ
ncbi:MAG TPA: phage tail sheath C-terminal domain-containing protein [Mariprofundaceae bacterium]|nr:phage tail sheath C-terminal domain-containing protein [Mariprofundaceae bacterium]